MQAKVLSRSKLKSTVAGQANVPSRCKIHFRHGATLPGLNITLRGQDYFASLPGQDNIFLRHKYINAQTNLFPHPGRMHTRVKTRQDPKEPELIPNTLRNYLEFGEPSKNEKRVSKFEAQHRDEPTPSKQSYLSRTGNEIEAWVNLKKKATK